MGEKNQFINEFKDYLRTLDKSGFEIQFIWGYASRLLANSAYLDCRDEIMHRLRDEYDDEGEHVIYEWMINTCTDPEIIAVYEECRKKTAFLWNKGDSRGELWSSIIEYGSNNDKELLRLQLRGYAYFIRDCGDRINQMLDDSLMDHISNDELASYKQDIEEMILCLSKEIYSMTMSITHNLYRANSHKE